MAKKSKAVKAVEMNVAVNVNGFETFSGTIAEVDENGVTLIYKKPRSSKHIRRFFPMSVVLAFEGQAGEEGMVVALNNASEAFSTFGSVVPSSINGFVEVSGEEGTFTVNAKYMTAQVLTD